MDHSLLISSEKPLYNVFANLGLTAILRFNESRLEPNGDITKAPLVLAKT